MLTALLSIVSLILTSFVMMKLWAWLVVPIFTLSALTFAQAMALRVVAWYMLPIPSLLEETYVRHWEIDDWETKSKEEKTLYRVLMWLIISAIYLLGGWILSFFV